MAVCLIYSSLFLYTNKAPFPEILSWQLLKINVKNEMIEQKKVRKGKPIGQHDITNSQ